MRLWSERIFPGLCERAMAVPALQERRRHMLAHVAGRVLEIGFGTGLSAALYPPAVRELVAVEPSEGMNERGRRRAGAASVPVTFLPGTAEALPFDAAEFDHVTCSLTLCSVSDPQRALAEIMRVLKPEGRFHFMEHVRSDVPERATWQDRLNPLQRMIGVGCNMNRNTPALIRSVGFDLPPVVQEMERALPFPKLFPIVQSVAVKPA